VLLPAHVQLHGATCGGVPQVRRSAMQQVCES
jgi:hypothetical protein